MSHALKKNNTQNTKSNITSPPVVLDAELLHQLEVLGVLVVHVTCHITSVIIFDEAGMGEGVPNTWGTAT